jgi:branched-chain amino acid transport system permease protein
MIAFLNYVVAGIAAGCAFGLVGTGFVTIYRVTRVVNFAQGALAVVGSFAAYALLHAGVPHVFAEFMAVLACGLLGALAGVLCLSRRNTPPISSLIITVAIAIFSYGVIIVIWGGDPISYDGLPGIVQVGAIRLQAQYLLVIAITVLAFGSLAIFFGRTYLGKALTACASNIYAARLVGIPTWRMGIAAFALAGLLGGLAGVALAPLRPMAFDSDLGLAMNGFAAAVFGGLQRPLMTLVGGLSLGLAEAMVAGYFRASYELAVALGLMLVMMIWQSRPHGTDH